MIFMPCELARIGVQTALIDVVMLAFYGRAQPREVALDPVRAALAVAAGQRAIDAEGLDPAMQSVPMGRLVSSQDAATHHMA